LAEFYWTALITVMNIALPYAVTRYDRSRLGPRELARAWNFPSWACAVYFFGPFCLPAHFVVTRRTVRGFLLGALWTVAVLALEELVGLGIESLAG
jgi:hypothetical protein